MGAQGQVDARFGPVRECFTEVARGQAGTGAAFDRVDALENALRSCLGLPPIPVTSEPTHG